VVAHLVQNLGTVFMSAVQALRIDDLHSGAVTRQRHVPNNPSRHPANLLHRNAPGSSFQSQQHGLEQHVHTKEPNGKTIQERPIDKISERDLARKVSEALVIDFGDYNSKHKRIAQAAGAASEKSAENWTQGHNAPSLLYGLRLMAASPTLRKEIMRLCAMEQDIDPEFQVAFAAFMKLAGKV
jgi:hypothetical protein